MLGILHPISAVKALLLSLKHRATAEGKTVKLSRPIEILAFGFEDGGRFFNANYFASRAVTGELVKTNELNTIVDEEGKSLATVLNENGFDGSKEAVARAKIEPEDVYGYVEMHIEQGPVLEVSILYYLNKNKVPHRIFVRFVFDMCIMLIVYTNQSLCPLCYD